MNKNFLIKFAFISVSMAISTSSWPLDLDAFTPELADCVKSSKGNNGTSPADPEKIALCVCKTVGNYSKADMGATWDQLRSKDVVVDNSVKQNVREIFLGRPELIEDACEVAVMDGFLNKKF